MATITLNDGDKVLLTTTDLKKKENVTADEIYVDYKEIDSTVVPGGEVSVMLCIVNFSLHLKNQTKPF